jgi:hypothetical protein
VPGSALVTRKYAAAKSNHRKNHAGLSAATEALSEMARIVTDKQHSPEVLFQAELAQVEVAAEDLVDV